MNVTDLLEKKRPKTTPSSQTDVESSPPDERPRTANEETMAKARAVFGSRSEATAERRRELEAASRRIAGILVPPRPEEPDNCCMSGCVNCVWERYRDEIEEWSAKSAEARAIIEEQKTKEGPKKTGGQAMPEMPGHVVNSMDDDGGGSETLWTGPDDALLASGGGKDPLADVPVGIREFMRIEKRLKERKAAASK